MTTKNIQDVVAERVEKLVKELRIVSSMINMCEKIRWGQETALMDEAAETIETLTQLVKEEKERIGEELMSEMVERIKNLDHKNNHICRFNDAPQKCECYYEGIETAQTIIKSK